MLTIITAVLIVVIILLLLTCWNTFINEDYLYGFWAAEGDEFCESSDISSMMIFIGERTGSLSITRECYIVIMNDLCNQSFTITYNPSWAALDIYKVDASVSFDEIAIWPDNVQISVDMRGGILMVYTDDILYAKLHKQHDTTNISRTITKIESEESTDNGTIQ